MRLVRSHGIGNDYLVLDSDHLIDAAAVRALCDRHRGVGGDGVLEGVPSEQADFGLRIWNPDGSQAEKSGNGLRIYARYLVDHCLAPLSFSVEVGGSVVRCSIDAETGLVTVQMGRATTVAEEVPCIRELSDCPVVVDGTMLRLNAIGMGNPHCVVFVDRRLAMRSIPDGGDPFEVLPWRAWGAALEQHALFPNRTNVQFVRVVDRHTLELRVWERGAGETLASGSSACAAAVAAVRLGRVDDPVRVCMVGGTLDITVSDELDVVMTGPVQEIGVIQTSRSFGEQSR